MPDALQAAAAAREGVPQAMKKWGHALASLRAEVARLDARVRALEPTSPPFWVELRADNTLPPGEAKMVSGDHEVQIVNLMTHGDGWPDLMTQQEIRLAALIERETRVAPRVSEDAVTYAYVDRDGAWKTRTVEAHGSKRHRLDLLREAVRACRLDHNESQRRTAYEERDDQTLG